MWTLCVVKLASWGQVSNFQGTLVTYRMATVQLSLKIWGAGSKKICLLRQTSRWGATAPPAPTPLKAQRPPPPVKAFCPRMWSHRSECSWYTYEAFSKKPSSFEVSGTPIRA